MMWIQKEITINTQGQKLYLITDIIISQLPELKHLKIGLLHLFLKHTSASLLISENYDPDVQHDLHTFFTQLSTLTARQFQHTIEGSDDMPAHILNATIGSSLIIPITNGKLNLGTWQGIYLYEHRMQKITRKIVATLLGDEK